jgi:Sporulation and spore germination
MRPGFLLLIAVSVATSCGGRDGQRIWFTTDAGSLRAVSRDVPPRPRLVLRALLAGPTPAEQNRGVRSDLPAGTELVAASRRDDLVRVYLRGRGLEPYQPNTSTFALRLSQLVYTLTELPRVERVQLFANGRPWGFRSRDHTIRHTYTRAGAPVVCEGTIWVGTPPGDCPAP